MEVEIISIDCIRPSSPTPQHLRTYNLSLLDQCIPSVYTPMVLFYPIDEDQSEILKDSHAIEKRSKLLKESLSQTLSGFYPLAGKIKDSLSIDCNDEGIYYVEARVKSNMSDFLNQPDLSLIQKCLPCVPTWNESVVGAYVAMVQTNVFDCGGITIGVYVTHMVADGVALSTFLKSWSATARGCCDGAEIISPDYTTAPSLFPQSDSFPKELSGMAMLYPCLRIGKEITRRFVFDSSALATMKAKASSLLVQNPTRVEVVSALIWKGAMAGFKANSSTQKPSLVSHVVNFRRRAGPPFSECTMGNLLGWAIAKCTAETETGFEKETELCHLVHELRRAITKVSNGFLKTLEGDQGFPNFCEALREMGGAISNAANSTKGKGVDFLGFTSWINFGLYEIDFGWGKPMWVTTARSRDEQASAFMNFVVLNETRWRNGIEAWVTLDQQDMAILECNEELLAFASLDPSPLQGLKGNEYPE